MNNKQEHLILETLFILLESCDVTRLAGTHLDPFHDIYNQKSKINDRLVEIQRDKEKHERRKINPIKA